MPEPAGRHQGVTTYTVTGPVDRFTFDLTTGYIYATGTIAHADLRPS